MYHEEIIELWIEAWKDLKDQNIRVYNYLLEKFNVEESEISDPKKIKLVRIAYQLEILIDSLEK